MTETQFLLIISTIYIAPTIPEGWSRFIGLWFVIFAIVKGLWK